MFVIRFVRVDQKMDEEYYYQSDREAINHLKLFYEDDSGLYKRIEVIDETTSDVIMTLPFNDGVSEILTLRH